MFFFLFDDIYFLKKLEIYDEAFAIFATIFYLVVNYVYGGYANVFGGYDYVFGGYAYVCNGYAYYSTKSSSPTIYTWVNWTGFFTHGPLVGTW